MCRFRIKESKESSHLSLENDVIKSLDTLSESKSRSRRIREGNYVGSNCLKVLKPELVRRDPSSSDEEPHLRIMLLCRTGIIQHMNAEFENVICQTQTV